MGKRLGEPPHTNDFDAFNTCFRSIGSRHNGTVKPKPCHLLKTIKPTGCRPYLTGETDLSKDHAALGKRPVTQGRHHGNQDSQVGRRLLNANAAHGIHKNILIKTGNASMAMKNGQQHGKPLAIKANSQPPWVGDLAVIDKRLKFHKQGATAF